MSIGQLACFLKDQRGGAAPLLALAALPLFASVGAAIDYSRAASARTGMQGAVDASALAMVKDAKNADTTILSATGEQYFRANFANAEVDIINTTTETGSTSSGYRAKVSATGTIKTKFMGLLGSPLLTITAEGEAASQSDGLGCVLALNRSADSAISGQGSSYTSLTGCSLYDNSDHSAAMTVGGSATIAALSVGVVGQVVGSTNILTTDGIRTGIGEVTDPYASASFPAFGACTSNNLTVNNSVTLQPGVYCGGISIHAGAVVTLEPGIYYIDGGDLTINGGGTLNGDQVTIVFTSQNRKQFASASINGNASINLTAPKTGPTAGIVLFGDRRMPSGTSFKFNGGVSQYLGGAVYLPRGAVEFSGGSSSSAACTQLIGDTIAFSGNSKISLNCSNYATRPFSPLVIKIVS